MNASGARGGMMAARRQALMWMAATLLGLASCHMPEPTLRVGTYPWPGFSTLHLAQALELFDSDQVRLVDFDNPQAVMQAFRDGEIDAAGLTLDESLRLAHDGHVGHVVLVFGHSKGGDALVAQSTIGSLGELRGRRIGVESGTEGAYLLARILDIAKLGAGDVEVVELAFEQQEAGFREGRVDAVITMDPVRGRLLAAGGLQLFSSREIEGELLDVLLVRESALIRQPGNLKTLVDAHFVSLENIRANPAAAAQRLEPRFGNAYAVVDGWNLIEFAGRGANLRLLSTGDLKKIALKVEEFMVQYGLLNPRQAPTPAIDDRFVRSYP